MSGCEKGGPIDPPTQQTGETDYSQTPTLRYLARRSGHWLLGLITKPGEFPHHEPDRKRHFVQHHTDRGGTHPADMPDDRVHFTASRIMHIAGDQFAHNRPDQIGVTKPDSPRSRIEHIVNAVGQEHPGARVGEKRDAKIGPTLG